MHERMRGSAAMGRACNISGAPAAGKIPCGHAGVACLVVTCCQRADMYRMSSGIYRIYQKILLPCIFDPIFIIIIFYYFKKACVWIRSFLLLHVGVRKGSLWPSGTGPVSTVPAAASAGLRWVGFWIGPSGPPNSTPNPQRRAAAAGPADWPRWLLRPCGRGFFLFFAPTSWSLVHFRTANGNNPTYRRWCTFVFHLHKCVLDRNRK